MLIYVCAPYSTNRQHSVEENREMALEYCRMIEEKTTSVPIAPHIYFYQFVDESDYEHAMDLCIELLDHCDAMYVYPDAGFISRGMQREIEHVSNKLHNTKITFVKDSDPLRGKFKGGDTKDGADKQI